jgi:hypothetical protein
MPPPSGSAGPVLAHAKPLRNFIWGTTYTL